MKALILAAGRGTRMQEFTQNGPKCLVPFLGRPLLQWQTAALRASGVNEISAVGGYESQRLRSFVPNLLLNERWNETNMVSSLLCASAILQKSTTIVSYSDIIFSSRLVEILKKSVGDICILSNNDWRELWEARFADPLSDAECFRVNEKGVITRIGGRARSIEEIEGQYMGLLKISPRGWAIIQAFLLSLPPGRVDKLDVTTLLSLLIERGVTVQAISVVGEWFEFDAPSDIRVAEEEVSNGRSWIVEKERP